MPLPKPYQHQPSTVASYDWTDISSGKGYKIFFAGKDDNGLFLLDQAVNSGYRNMTTISANLPASTPAKMVDADFDTTFDTEQIIDGVTVINGTIGYVTTAGGPGTAKSKIIVQALKNGVHIVSGPTALQNMGSADNSPDSYEFSMNFDFPKTAFSIGDTLRFTCEVWAYDSGTSSNKVSLAHDGGDRDDAQQPASSTTILDAHSTQLKFFVPFQIDL